MLQVLMTFYLQGLLIAVGVVFMFGVIYLVRRARLKRDVTANARQATLYDTLMAALLTIPILSFAFMALLLVIRS